MTAPLSSGTRRDAPRRPLVVVLGASGNIGSAAVREFSRHRIQLRAVARRPSPVPANCRAEVEMVRADLTKKGAVTDAVRGASAVIHLVARMKGEGSWRSVASDPGAERVNVDLVREVIAECGGRGADGPPPTVLLASTTQTADSGPQRSAYTRQKAAAERHLFDAAARGTIRGIALRLPTVVGSKAGVTSLMADRALSGEALTMWHDGAVRRELLDVSDVARAFVAALDHAVDLDGRAWVIGGHAVPLRELFRTIADSAARHTGLPPVPVLSVPPPDYAQADDFRDLDVDSSAFRDMTGWRAKVPLRQAVDSVVSSVAFRRALPRY